MSQGPLETEIDGHSIRLGLLSTDDAVELVSRLAKLLGPGLASASTGGGADIIGRVLLQHEPKEVRALIKKVLRTCLVDGKPLFTDGGEVAYYDAAFRGNLVLLGRVVAWAIKANTGDFTELLATLKERAKAVLAMRAAQGTSGESGGIFEMSTPSSVS